MKAQTCICIAILEIDVSHFFFRGTKIAKFVISIIYTMSSISKNVVNADSKDRNDRFLTHTVTVLHRGLEV